MIISVRMNGSIWLFNFRYLPTVEIYHRDIFHRYKQTNSKWIEQRMQSSIIKEDERRNKDMKQYTMNWDQTNVTHENKISKYTEIGKIWSFRLESMGRYDFLVLDTYRLQ